MDEPIVFGTDGWRAELDTFTTERVEIVAQSVAAYLSSHGIANAPLAIGYDPRDGSRGFARAAAEVIRNNGIEVRLAGRDIPTPALAWNIAERRLAGGLMITASHNPPEYNGIKFITSDGSPALPSVTNALESLLSEPRSVPAAHRASIEPLDGIDAYLEHVVALVGTDDISDLRIVYDAMHGSGRGVTDRVLKTAGAEVESLRCTRDPTFGGAGPEPSQERLETLIETVSRTGADLGLANDGDADRVAVVTPDHGYLDPNLLFACAYDYLLESGSGPVIRSVPTTSLVDRVAAEHDEEVIETQVGFKWIAHAMREHDALMGGEESGGFSIRGHVREKDGVLMALLVAAMEASVAIDDRLEQLFATHGTIVQDRSGIPCPNDQKDALISALGEALPDEIAGSPIEGVSEVDGYKVTLADGSWMLVRPSGTEPVMRIYAEAGTQARVDDVLDAGRSLLRSLQ